MEPELFLRQQLLLKKLPFQKSETQLNKIVTHFLQTIKGKDLVNINEYTIRLGHEIITQGLSEHRERCDLQFAFLYPYISSILLPQISITQTKYNIEIQKVLNLLATAHFPNLKKIHLQGNQELKIKQIPAFQYPKIFENLEVISLPKNKIEDVTNILSNSLIQLRQFDLSNNLLPNFNVFQNKRSMLNLRIMNLSHNLIVSICWLGEIDAPSLEVLDLSFNKISSIKVLNRTYFPQLRQLFLTANLTQEFIPLGNISSSPEIEIYFYPPEKLGKLEPQIYITPKLADSFACDYCKGEFDFTQISTGFLLGGFIPEWYRQKINNSGNSVRDKIKAGRKMRFVKQTANNR